jgi:hypothetical protein
MRRFHIALAVAELAASIEDYKYPSAEGRLLPLILLSDDEAKLGT